MANFYVHSIKDHEILI